MCDMIILTGGHEGEDADKIRKRQSSWTGKRSLI